MIDCRSDTVTVPSESMRGVMASAEVGDDVYGEDPSINALEKYAAELCGKESALYVPTGTMGNIISVLCHCQRGEELILGDRSHLFLYERGSTAALAGVHPRQIANLDDGTFSLDSIRAAIRGNDVHFPTTRLICLEQTHNVCGGTVLPLQFLKDVHGIANENNLKVHIDGARVMNACVKLGVSPKQMLEFADSCTFCLSKGLGAPVGSVVVGTRAFIDSARRWRKALGGGMRQAGIIASAGLFALQKHYPLLADDHEKAQVFARTVKSLLGEDAVVVVGKDPSSGLPETNICIMKLSKPDAVRIKTLAKEKGLLLSSMSDHLVRAVFHLNVSMDQARKAAEIFCAVFQSTL
eukprot:ANDGO_06891.mRNA.1 L-allo-threonine aldolase